MPTLVRDRSASKAAADEPAEKSRKRREPSRRSSWRARRRERKNARRAAKAQAALDVDSTTGGSRRAVEIDDTTGKRSIDPRIKERREAVLDCHRRRRRRRFFACLLLVTLGVAGYFTAKSSLLAVQTVDVTAAPHTNADDIRKAAAIRPDLHMFDVDEAAIARRIEALPWVDKATVQRSWPRTVTITVTERAIRAVVPDGAGGWLTVDRTGRVLGPTPPVSSQFVPHIEGLPAVAPGQTMDPKIAGALAISSKLTISLAGRIAAIDVTPEGTVDLKLNPKGKVWFGRAEDQLDEKVRSLQTMLAQADLRDMCRLDLRVPSSPVLTRDPVCA